MSLGGRDDFLVVIFLVKKGPELTSSVRQKCALGGNRIFQKKFFHFIFQKKNQKTPLFSGVLGCFV